MHANAAGFSIPKKNIDAFISYANQALANMDLTEGIYEVDYIKDAREDWPEMHDMIMELGGHKFWGQGCPEPLIAIENLVLKQNDIQICGAKMNTVRIIQNGITYIAFNAEEMIEELKGKKLVSLTVVGEPNINVFNYTTSPQIMIKDYNIKDITLEF